MSVQPSQHQIRAAIEVARIVDASGNPYGDVRSSYRLALTDGAHRVESFVAGEELLLSLGLLFERDGRLFPAEALTVLARVEGSEAERVVRARHASVFDQDLLDRIGAAGEDLVADACRAELVELGRADLASNVQRVSLADDSLGYDVSAPSVSFPTRLLEVKTSGRNAPGLFEFYLTRNEYDTGRRSRDAWYLVGCRWDGSVATVIGWCQAAGLSTYLPTDGQGRWMEALVRLPKQMLTPGIPPPV